MPIVIAGVVNPPPAAPTLISPTNGSSEDLAGTPTFQWQYNAAQPGQTQTGWEFYVLLNGGSQAQYWNASTNAWQSTAPNPPNSGSQQSYTFPTGAFSDGNTYQWTVATQDGNGQGPAPAYWTVIAQAAPVVNVTAPSGIITTAAPVITWAVTTPKGANQTTYRVVIYNNSQYTAGGFTPGSGPSVFDTGQQGSSSVVSVNLAAVPLYLPNGTQYRAYVQVTETGNEYSEWAYSAFSTYYAQPKAPTITVAPSADSATGCPLIEIAVASHNNVLDLDNAIDPARGTGVGTWSAGANTTLGSGSIPLNNTFGLSMTAQAAGTISAACSYEYIGPGSPVQGGSQYTAIASLIAATAGRSFTVGLVWYGPPGEGGVVGTATGATFADVTTGLVQGYVTATAPENAFFVGVTVTVEGAAAGEVHWFQQVGVFPGDDTTWGPGGFIGNQQVILQRSDGLYVRNASIANPATISPPSPIAVIYDYEAVPHADCTYAATVLAARPTAIPALSSPVTSGQVTLVTTQWWEFDPTDPSGAINAQFVEWKPVQTEQSTAQAATGAQVLTMVANTMLYPDFTGTAEIFSDSVSTPFEALLSSQKTLFISSPWGGSDTGYFRIGPMTGGMSMGVGNQTKNTTLNKSVYGAGHRKVAVMAIAQNRPVV